jgi:diketogulonate reductase-like aldo/keto reductase
VQKRALGWTGVHLPLIGQGTWQTERDDPAAVVEALQRGIDAGMTHLDTAELYGQGEVEKLVARALVGRRDQVFLVSKVLPTHASYQGTLEACERTLARLGTDRLDLYLLHWPGPYPLEETLRAFETLRLAGKIRFYGVSNFAVPELERAIRIIGERRIACNQLHYHLEGRAIEHEVIPFCDEHQIAVVGYSPFARGRFVSRLGGGARTLAEIARAHGATPRQVALSFLVRKEGLFTIPKASRASHALENAGAGDLVLAPDEVAKIDQAFPVGPRRDRVFVI